jgi:hypothetical protein
MNEEWPEFWYSQEIWSGHRKLHFYHNNEYQYSFIYPLDVRGMEESIQVINYHKKNFDYQDMTSTLQLIDKELDDI